MHVGIQTLFLADVIEPSSIVNNIYDDIYEDKLSGVVHLKTTSSSPGRPMTW